MYYSVSVIPEAGDIHARMHGGPEGRTRVIDFGGVTLHVVGRSALDALQAALDTIRADMESGLCGICKRRPADGTTVSLSGIIIGTCGTCAERREDAPDAHLDDWSPGELTEAFGR